MKSHFDTTIPFPQWVFIMDTTLSVAMLAEYVNSCIISIIEIWGEYNVISKYMCHVEVFDVKLILFFFFHT